MDLKMVIWQFKVLEQTRNEHPVAALFETFAIWSGKGQESLFFLWRSGAMPLEGFFSPQDTEARIFLFFWGGSLG